MKVKELIEKLQTLDNEMDIVIAGCEGGVDDVTRISAVRVERNTNTEWYYGKHEKIDDDSDKYENAIRVYQIS